MAQSNDVRVYSNVITYCMAARHMRKRSGLLLTDTNEGVMSDNKVSKQTDDASKERIHGSSEIEEAIMKAIDSLGQEKNSEACKNSRAANSKN